MPTFPKSRSKSFRSLCWLMTLFMAIAPSIPALAQDQAPLKLQYLAPGSAAVVAARPQQLLTCETATMLPIEVLSAAALKEFGFDPVNITQVVISVTPPLLGPPLYSATITLDEPIEIASLPQKIIAHTKPAEHNGRTYLRSQHPFLPSFGWADEHTLLIAPEVTLKQLLSQETPAVSPIANKLTLLGGHDDLITVVDLEALRGLIQMGLAQAADQAPAEVQPFLAIPTLLKSIHLRANLSGAGPWELVAQANSEADAEKIAALIDEGVQIFSFRMGEQAEEMLASKDSVEQAMGKYLQRITPQWAEQMKPVRKGNQFTVFYANPNDQNAGLSSMAVIGVLVGLLLPAVQSAREAARHNASLNNVKNIMLALHNYADVKKSFPAHANYSAEGKPLLSWRVHLLPYLEQQALYKQFHLDEPWDSEHNRPLISQMPELFLDPSSGRSLEAGRTHYLGVKGKGFAFDGTDKGRRFTNFRDGTSMSIMILQVNDQRAAIWTKPDDWELDSKNPLQGLRGSMHPGIFLAGFADGHCRTISETIDTETFQHLLTIDGKEVINSADY